jgi:F-type H+-transporting ATPase subunit delta
LREPTIARNYADALFVFGERTGETELFQDLMDGLSQALASETAIRVVLESPTVPKSTKQAILRRALEGRAPEGFLRFLNAVVKRGRQGLLPAIAEQFGALVDEKLNRVHARVTVAREPDRELQDVVRQRLSEVIGKEVIPHFRTDSSILGGLIVRVGDRIMDGSLRRRMLALRQRMLTGS